MERGGDEIYDSDVEIAPISELDISPNGFLHIIRNRYFAHDIRDYSSIQRSDLPTKLAYRIKTSWHQALSEPEQIRGSSSPTLSDSYIGSTTEQTSSHALSVTTQCHAYPERDQPQNQTSIREAVETTPPEVPSSPNNALLDASPSDFITTPAGFPSTTSLTTESTDALLTDYLDSEGLYSGRLRKRNLKQRFPFLAELVCDYLDIMPIHILENSFEQLMRKENEDVNAVMKVLVDAADRQYKQKKRSNRGSGLYELDSLYNHIEKYVGKRSAKKPSGETSTEKTSDESQDGDFQLPPGRNIEVNEDLANVPRISRDELFGLNDYLQVGTQTPSRKRRIHIDDGSEDPTVVSDGYPSEDESQEEAEDGFAVVRHKQVNIYRSGVLPAMFYKKDQTAAQKRSAKRNIPEDRPGLAKKKVARERRVEDPDTFINDEDIFEQTEPPLNFFPEAHDTISVYSAEESGDEVDPFDYSSDTEEVDASDNYRNWIQQSAEPSIHSPTVEEDINPEIYVGGILEDHHEVPTTESASPRTSSFQQRVFRNRGFEDNRVDGMLASSSGARSTEPKRTSPGSRSHKASFYKQMLLDAFGSSNKARAPGRRPVRRGTPVRAHNVTSERRMSAKLSAPGSGGALNRSKGSSGARPPRTVSAPTTAMFGERVLSKKTKKPKNSPTYLRPSPGAILPRQPNVFVPQLEMENHRKVYKRSPLTAGAIASGEEYPVFPEQGSDYASGEGALENALFTLKGLLEAPEFHNDCFFSQFEFSSFLNFDSWSYRNTEALLKFDFKGTTLVFSKLNKQEALRNFILLLDSAANSFIYPSDEVLSAILKWSILDPDILCFEKVATILEERFITRLKAVLNGSCGIDISRTVKFVVLISWIRLQRDAGFKRRFKEVLTFFFRYAMRYSYEEYLLSISKDNRFTSRGELLFIVHKMIHKSGLDFVQLVNSAYKASDKLMDGFSFVYIFATLNGSENWSWVILSLHGNRDTKAILVEIWKLIIMANWKLNYHLIKSVFKELAQRDFSGGDDAIANYIIRTVPHPVYSPGESLFTNFLKLFTLFIREIPQISSKDVSKFKDLLLPTATPTPTENSLINQFNLIICFNLLTEEDVATKLDALLRCNVKYFGTCLNALNILSIINKDDTIALLVTCSDILREKQKQSAVNASLVARGYSYLLRTSKILLESKPAMANDVYDVVRASECFSYLDFQDGLQASLYEDFSTFSKTLLQPLSTRNCVELCGVLLTMVQKTADTATNRQVFSLWMFSLHELIDIKRGDHWGAYLFLRWPTLLQNPALSHLELPFYIQFLSYYQGNDVDYMNQCSDVLIKFVFRKQSPQNYVYEYVRGFYKSNPSHELLDFKRKQNYSLEGLTKANFVATRTQFCRALISNILRSQTCRERWLDVLLSTLQVTLDSAPAPDEYTDFVLTVVKYLDAHTQNLFKESFISLKQRLNVHCAKLEKFSQYVGSSEQESLPQFQRRLIIAILENRTDSFLSQLKSSVAKALREANSVLEEDGEGERSSPLTPVTDLMKANISLLSSLPQAWLTVSYCMVVMADIVIENQINFSQHDYTAVFGMIKSFGPVLYTENAVSMLYKFRSMGSYYKLLSVFCLTLVSYPDFFQFNKIVEEQQQEHISSVRSDEWQNAVLLQAISQSYSEFPDINHTAVHAIDVAKAEQTYLQNYAWFAELHQPPSTKQNDWEGGDGLDDVLDETVLIF